MTKHSHPHELTHSRHSVHALNVHLVFVTKFRHRVLTDAHLTRMEDVCRDVCAALGARVVEFNGEADHVHALVNYPPTLAISTLVQRLKGTSSRVLRAEFPELDKHYWRAKALWTTSYFAASSGGVNLDVRYVQNQSRPT